MKIIQKQKPYSTSFEFGSEQLEYSFTNKHNVQGGSISYQNIPLLWRSHLKKIWLEKYVALSVGAFGVVTYISRIASTPLYQAENPIQHQDYVIGTYMILVACIFVSVLIFIMQMIGRPPTITVTRYQNQPDICVIQDEQHDNVMSQIQKRRTEALRRKLAFIDPLETSLNASHKFRWLRENDVITEQEFEEFMSQLASQELLIIKPEEEKKTFH